MRSTATTVRVVPTKADAPRRPGLVLLMVCVAIFMLMLDEETERHEIAIRPKGGTTTSGP